MPDNAAPMDQGEGASPVGREHDYGAEPISPTVADERPLVPPPSDSRENVLVPGEFLSGARESNPAGFDPFDEGADRREPSPEPIAAKERLLALDVLRGIALFGILAVNMESFSMITNARRNPGLGGGEGTANYVVWLLTWVLADTKFIAIFSMLFGAGIVMRYSKGRERHHVAQYCWRMLVLIALCGFHIRFIWHNDNASFYSIFAAVLYVLAGVYILSGCHSVAAYYRRMAALIAIGWLHAHYIWDGDILWFYGVYGLFLYVFAGLPGSVLLILGLVGIGIDGFIWGWPWAPVNYGRAIYEIHAYRSPYLGYQMDWRWNEAYYMETAGTIQFAMQGMGLMLFGMGLLKCRVITAQLQTWFYALVAVIAFPAGIALIGIPSSWGKEFIGGRIFEFWNFERVHDWLITRPVLERDLTDLWDGDLYWEPHGASFVLGSLLVTFGWISAAMLLTKWFPQGWFTRSLAAVGRMALTNYLMHSVICTTIFYGHGLGLFEKLERVHQAAIVAAICLTQLLLSPLWFRVFRFGPVEWLWRTITYWRWQPFLKERRTAPTTPHMMLREPPPLPVESRPYLAFDTDQTTDAAGKTERPAPGFASGQDNEPERLHPPRH